MKLEELARQSSDAARFSVAHLDPPSLGGDSRVRDRAPMMLGAAVLVVAVLGAIFVLRDDPPETLTADSRKLPVLGLGDPASFGLTLSGVFDPDRQGGQLDHEEFSATFVYLGTSGADAVVVAKEPFGMFADATVIEWLEMSGDGRQHKMILASSVLTADDLALVADGLDLSGGVANVVLGDAATLPPAVRDLEVVAVGDALPQLFSTFRGGAGPVVGYESAESISATMVEGVGVSSFSGALSDVIIADRWWASSAELAEVRGQPAWLLTYELDDTGAQNGDPPLRAHSVVWQWAPEVTASVTAVTSGGSELAVAVAQAVVELDPATVDAAQDEVREEQASGDLEEVWATGSSEVESDIDGAPVAWAWAIGLQDGQFCTALSVGSGGSSSCEPLAQFLARIPDAPVVVAQQQMDALQLGVIAASTGQVVVPAEGTTGELTEVPLPNDADGTRLLVWVGGASDPPRFDLLVDDEIVATLDLADGVAATEATVEQEEGALFPPDGEVPTGSEVEPDPGV